MMRMRIGVALGAAACLAARAGAANIYVMSSGDPPTDNAVVAALTSHGHTVTVGVTYNLFDGTVSLSGFQTVYLQANFNWTSGLMPAAGQQQLISYVMSGGRLVTCEWVTYYTYPAGGNFEMLGAVLPLQQSYMYADNTSATYDLATPDPTINAGVSAPLTFAVTSYTGTETLTAAKPGATVYYTSESGVAAVGLAGWAQGSGNVFSFSTTCGPDQLGDANFGRLFSNVMGAAGSVCYANCDGSTAPPILNIADFVCFQQQFAAGNAYANCDGSTAPPVLNIADFVCFQQHFAAGCP